MKIKYFLPTFLFGVIIIITSALPMEFVRKLQYSLIPLRITLSNYCLHFFAFGIFTAFLFYGFYRAKNRPYLICIGFISLLFVVLIEIFQMFIPYREFEFIDMIPGFVGIIFSLILIKLFLRIRESLGKK